MTERLLSDLLSRTDDKVELPNPAFGFLADRRPASCPERSGMACTSCRAARRAPGTNLSYSISKLAFSIGAQPEPTEKDSPSSLKRACLVGTCSSLRCCEP